jgi:hypothetical protein
MLSLSKKYVNWCIILELEAFGPVAFGTLDIANSYEIVETVSYRPILLNSTRCLYHVCNVRICQAIMWFYTSQGSIHWNKQIQRIHFPKKWASSLIIIIVSIQEVQTIKIERKNNDIRPWPKQHQQQQNDRAVADNSKVTHFISIPISTQPWPFCFPHSMVGGKKADWLLASCFRIAKRLKIYTFLFLAGTPNWTFY